MLSDTVKPLSIVSEGIAKDKRSVRENNSCRKVTYVCDIQGPEEVNNTFMETMRVGTMDSGFTVFFLFICDVNINSLE
jgi:hypothetical protein